MNTTLAEIRAHSPCSDGWKKLLKHLGKTKADSEPLAIVEILDVNGIDDALWCLRAVRCHDREIQLFAVWCARQVQHLMTDDPRSVAVLDVAERLANGEASEQELVVAHAVAWVVAHDVAWAAARDAASDAAYAAHASSRDAAHAAARAAARGAQEKELRAVCAGIAERETA